VDIHVVAERQGEHYVVRASAEMGVPSEIAWEVITDYDNLEKFIPDMSDSHVVIREGNRVVVAQTGKARFLFFSRSIQVSLEVEETPFTRVTSRAIAGDFKEMEGSYVLEKQTSGVVLRYDGRLVPDFFVPPLIGTRMVKGVVEGQFRAMVQEIVRRAGKSTER
jgi:ribosome-associated toxin RatA of RatAB toxin-antitoxin module